jgi:hypothetical protein
MSTKARVTISKEDGEILEMFKIEAGPRMPTFYDEVRLARAVMNALENLFEVEEEE